MSELRLPGLGDDQEKLSDIDPVADRAGWEADLFEQVKPHLTPEGMEASVGRLQKLAEDTPRIPLPSSESLDKDADPNVIDAVRLVQPPLNKEDASVLAQMSARFFAAEQRKKGTNSRYDTKIVEKPLNYVLFGDENKKGALDEPSQLIGAFDMLEHCVLVAGSNNLVDSDRSDAFLDKVQMIGLKEVERQGLTEPQYASVIAAISSDRLYVRERAIAESWLAMSVYGRPTTEDTIEHYGLAINALLTHAKDDDVFKNGLATLLLNSSHMKDALDMPVFAQRLNELQEFMAVRVDSSHFAGAAVLHEGLILLNKRVPTGTGTPAVLNFDRHQRSAYENAIGRIERGEVALQDMTINQWRARLGVISDYSEYMSGLEPGFLSGPGMGELGFFRQHQSGISKADRAFIEQLHARNIESPMLAKIHYAVSAQESLATFMPDIMSEAGDDIEASGYNGPLERTTNLPFTVFDDTGKAGELWELGDSTDREWVDSDFVQGVIEELFNSGKYYDHAREGALDAARAEKKITSDTRNWFTKPRILSYEDENTGEVRAGILVRRHTTDYEEGRMASRQMPPVRLPLFNDDESERWTNDELLDLAEEQRKDVLERIVRWPTAQGLRYKIDHPGFAESGLRQIIARQTVNPRFQRVDFVHRSNFATQVYLDYELHPRTTAPVYDANVLAGLGFWARSFLDEYMTHSPEVRVESDERSEEEIAAASERLRPALVVLPSRLVYLPLKQDGNQSQFSQERAAALMEERGKDLALESVRLAELDRTGLGRSSTYRSGTELDVRTTKPVALDTNSDQVYWPID